MGALETITALRRFDFSSRSFDLDLLAHVLEEGIVGEEAVAPAIALIEEEARDIPLFPNGLALPIDRVPQDLPPPLAFRERQTPGSSSLRQFNDAQSLLAALIAAAPQAAEPYSLWMDRISGRISDLPGWTTDRKTAAVLDTFLDTASAELAWQRIFERHFWNGVRVSALEKLDAPAAPLLWGAHRLFASMGARNSPENVAAGAERAALAAQLPLLSAAALFHLAPYGTLHLLQIGAEVVLEIEGQGTFTIAAPQIAGLDVPAMVEPPPPAEHEVISFPVGHAAIEGDVRDRVRASFLFDAHPEKLLPTDAFWGADYPIAPPTREELRALATKHFPADATLLSLDEPKRFGRLDLARDDAVAAAWNAGGQVLHLRVLPSRGDGSYAIGVGSSTIAGFEAKPDVELILDIRNGAIAAARYFISSSTPLVLAVNSERLSDLIARATFRNTPTPSPINGGTPANNGGVSSLGGIVSGEGGDSFAAPIAMAEGRLYPSPMSLVLPTTSAPPFFFLIAPPALSTPMAM